MEIRKYHYMDYPLIESWWKRTGEVPPDSNRIPEESSFSIQDEDGTLLAMISVYITDDGVGFPDNLIGNPDCDKVIRKKAIRYLIDYLEKYASRAGCYKLISFIKKESLVRYYEQYGYKAVASNLTAVAKEI